MGLLDGILTSVLGNFGNSPGLGPVNDNSAAPGGPLGGIGGSVATSALIALGLRVLQQNGGISGVVEKMRQAGLGAHAASWVSTGENLPVSGEQLQSALGSGELAQLASHFGLTPEQASSGLAQVLPQLVNQMTPAGEVPADHQDTISDALSMLQKRMG